MENQKENPHEENFKWSWGKFIVGKSSNKFIAFLASTALVFLSVFKGIVASEKTETVIFIVWGAVTVIFMLAGAIDDAVRNAKISAELKAGAGVEKIKTVNL